MHEGRPVYPTADRIAARGDDAGRSESDMRAGRASCGIWEAPAPRSPSEPGTLPKRESPVRAARFDLLSPSKVKPPRCCPAPESRLGACATEPIRTVGVQQINARV